MIESLSPFPGAPPRERGVHPFPLARRPETVVMPRRVPERSAAESEEDSGANVLAPLPPYEDQESLSGSAGLASVLAARALSQAAGDDVAADWQVGDVIVDLYEVAGLLGEGGMGKVFRVRHRGWDVEMAVKCPRPEIFSAEQGKEDFIHEAETWVNLGLHPHTVSCYYVRTLGGIPRVFAEFVQGGSLAEWIYYGQLYEGTASQALGRILDIAIQFAWGLHYAHEQGLVHQDVKTGNVMMTVDGTAKVTDFGLARARAGLKADAPACTPEYASPEQMAGYATVASDIWCWGNCMVEIFSGRMPTEGPDAVAFLETYLEVGAQNPAIPPMPSALVELLRLIFQDWPPDRPQSLAEIAETLKVLYREATGDEYHRTQPRAALLQADGLNNRAVSLLDLGRSDEALKLLDAALDSDGHHIYATYNRGLLLWRNGHWTDEALLQSIKELSTASSAWEISYLTGWIHIERGDAESARTLLTEARGRAGSYAYAADQIHHAMSRVPRGGRRSHQLEGHTEFVNSLALRRDGRLAISGGGDGVVQVWDVQGGQSARTLKGHVGVLQAVAVAAGRSLFYSGGEDGIVRVWDGAAGRQIRALAGHQGSVNALAPTGDGLHLLSAGSDGTVRLWDVQNGQSMLAFPDHQVEVLCLAIMPDGRVAASGDASGWVRIWHLGSESCIHVLGAHQGAVRTLAMTSNGRYLVSGGDDHRAVLWDMVAGSAVRFLEGHSDSVSGVALTMDGSVAVTTSHDRTLRIWSLETGQCLRTMDGQSGRLHGLAVGQDGRMALVASVDASISAWELPEFTATSPPMVVRPRKSEEVLHIEEGFARKTAEARQAMERSDWKSAVAAARAARKVEGRERVPESLALWAEVAPYALRGRFREAWVLQSFEGHQGWVSSVALTPDGRIAVTGGEDRSVRVWDVTSGVCVAVLEGHDAMVNQVAVAANGQIAVSMDQEGLIAFWDLATGLSLRMMQGHGQAMGMTTDGRFLVAPSPAGQLALWEVMTGRLLRTLDDQGSAVALTPDCRYVISGDLQGVLRVWDVSSGKVVRTLTGHTDGIRAVVVTPDGRTAISASEDMTIRVWDVPESTCRKILKGHSRAVWDLDLTPDGKVLASSAKDRTVRIWDVGEGTCAATLLGHTDWVTGVALSGNGHRAVSASKDGSMRHWFIDWELQARDSATWDEGARPCLEAFLSHHTPFANPDLLHPDGLTRKGWATWQSHEFNELLEELGRWGYRWLTPQGVYQALSESYQKWQGPPPL